MDFALTEEQTELSGIVKELLAKRADSAAVRTAMESESGYDPALWATLCEQIGAAALAIPEEFEGAGFSLFETLLVVEQLGYSLAPSPLLPSLIAAEAVLASGDPDAQARILPRIAAGETATFVTAPEWGPAPRVLLGDQAEIVIAATDAGVVEYAGADLDRTWTPAMDPTIRLATVRLPDSGGTPIEGSVEQVRARARLAGTAGVAALELGCMQRGLDMTVDYAGTRVQFGRPIGSFQAVKHWLADLLVLVEMSRSASWAASYAVSTHAESAERLAAVAAAYCGEAVTEVAGEVIQLHGGIAITWEHDAHLVFKRAHALNQLFGQPHQHRALVLP